MIPYNGASICGFSGGIVKFSNGNGFEDCPEWMDNTSDHQINILFLEEILNINELAYFFDDET
jgi:hypothetical protein